MTDAEALAEAEAHIARLEEIVADYALRYGLSDCARAVFGLRPTQRRDADPPLAPPTAPAGLRLVARPSALRPPS